jgi:hypothetical protein
MKQKERSDADTPQSRAELEDNQNSRKNLFTKRGDLILSDCSLPKADSIISLGYTSKKLQLNLRHLQSYLEFLEFVVLHERLCVGIWDIHPEVPRDVYESEAFRETTYVYWLKGELDIDERVLKVLEKEGILYYVRPMLERQTPAKYVDRYIESSLHMKKMHKQILALLKSRGIASSLREGIAYWHLINDFGRPFYLSEFARMAKLPYYLSPSEVENLAWLECTELRLCESVIEYLKKHLDEGARRVLDRLEKFGCNTIFPETPIASYILFEASKPEEMLQIALDLREKYKSFRHNFSNLETILLDEAIPLRKKRRLLIKIEAMANEIWPKTPHSLRQETLELSGLLNVIPKSIANLEISNIGTLAGMLLSRPVDLLMSALRRRKIRVMLKSKKRFLHTSKWIVKLAKLFSLDQERVRDAFEHD